VLVVVVSAGGGGKCWWWQLVLLALLVTSSAGIPSQVPGLRIFLKRVSVVAGMEPAADLSNRLTAGLPVVTLWGGHCAWG
jgi:hypothetical protein